MTVKIARLHRVVAMASLFELLGTVHFDDLEGYKCRESGVFEYSNSKIMVIMAAREMNKRLKVKFILATLLTTQNWTCCQTDFELCWGAAAPKMYPLCCFADCRIWRHDESDKGSVSA